MKRFTKICLIIAMILGIVSIGCFIIGGILGADLINTFEAAFDPEDYSIDFDKEYDMEEFTLKKQFEADEIQSLSIDMDFGTVVIRTVSSDACRVLVAEGSYADTLTVSSSDSGLLKIEETVLHKHFGFSFSIFGLSSFLKHGNLQYIGTRIIVELPEKTYHRIEGTIDFGAMKFYDLDSEQMNLEVDAGVIYSEGTLKGDNIEVRIGMGNASIDTLECEKSFLSADIGKLDIKSVTAKTLELDANMGNIDLNRAKAETLTADCDMGNITMGLVGKPEEYDISYDVDMGNVDIEDYDRSKGNALYKVDLNCEMGDIDVTFLR